MNPRDMARALGQRGGRVRAKRLSTARKKQIAARGGVARAKSLQIARRIEANFAYAAAVLALQGGSRTITRHKRFNDRLPGIYPRTD